MKIRILKKNKDNLNVYREERYNISYEELEELLNTYDKVIMPRLNWTDRGIHSLPENFGNLEVKGDLDLNFNKLTSLPESFGNLKVAGSLDLSFNQLTSLPESFGNLKVAGSLDLSFNQLTSLPESFGNLKIRGNLYLGDNELTSLPESFGNLKVVGGLYLDKNKLTSLPESFGNLEVEGGLYLHRNKLTSLPESFGNLKVGGKLWLQDNPWIIDTDFVNFYEKYKGELVLGKKLEKEINRLIKLKEWEESIVDEKLSIPKYLYHATYKPFLKSIKEKGLGNTRKKMWSDSVSGVVYLATNEDVAYSYAEIAEWLDDIEDYEKYVDNIVILKIDTDKLDKTRFKKDSNVIDGDDTFEYHGIIPFEFVEEILDKHHTVGALSDRKEDIDSSINDAVKTNSFTPYTAGYILEDGSLLVMDEYHGEAEVREFYPEYSNTYPEEDTCVRLYGRPNEAQYKRLKEIIDYYLDHEGYCKVEVWDKPLGKYSFYEVYSLYEGACKDTTWDEKIGNWTGYKLVQIIKNYFAFGAK